MKPLIGAGILATYGAGLILITSGLPWSGLAVVVAACVLDFKYGHSE